MIIKKITDELFGCELFVVIGCDFKKANQVIKKKYRVFNNQEIPYAADGVSIELTTGWYIWCKRNSPEIVSHEVLHVTQRVLERAGIMLSHETKEVYAYYLSWVITKINHKEKKNG